MEPVVSLLNNLFSRMKLKGESVIPHDAATEKSVQEFFEEIHQIDPSLQRDKLTQIDLKNAHQWHLFLKNHCRCRHYSFQVKKCLDSSCSYCSNHPPEIPSFSEIHFLPDPIPSDQAHLQAIQSCVWDGKFRQVSTINERSRHRQSY